MTLEGGSGYGVLFSFDITNNLYTKLKDFNYTDGAQPFGSLMQASNGKLYGTTEYGGIDGGGILFCYDLTTQNFNKLRDFYDTDGARPSGKLMQASDNKLYGSTITGGFVMQGSLIHSILQPLHIQSFKTLTLRPACIRNIPFSQKSPHL